MPRGTSTIKCEQCGAEIYPEEETAVIEDEIQGVDLVVCERCAYKKWKSDAARKRMLHQLVNEAIAEAEERREQEERENWNNDNFTSRRKN